jgi:predicted metalloprotease with PDZ domain
MQAPIVYRVRAAEPAAHYFDISLQVTGPDPAGQRLTLPAWIPGSYMIRDFARNIVTIRAASDGQAVRLQKLDKQTWLAPPVAGELAVEYRVYAWDLSVRAAHLDQTHGYFNGPSLFLRVVGQEGCACDVELLKSDDPATARWRVATTLPALATDPAGFGRYRAPDYETLIDHPVEMADWTELRFEVAGVPHAMAITGRHGADLTRLARDLTRICAEHVALFGAPLPTTRYLFLTLAVGEGYGGLEHRDSTSLLCSRDDLPTPDLEQPTEGYRRFLGLCSHEYFHLWNVKRIRPAALAEADLSREVHTVQLWAFEGITSYYDDLALVRSGCIDGKSYLELLAQTITRVMRGAGRLGQSVAESSFDAWTKFYKQDENAPNAIVSYYAKGGLVALGLDMLLRERSAERLSLDDLMRELWQRYGQTGIGVPETGIEHLAGELLGADLSDFFQRAVYGTDDLPLVDWLAGVGVGMRLRPAAKPDDPGGVCDAPQPVSARRVLGARFRAAGELVELTHVFAGGAAQAAGLSAGDRLIALNGIQVKADSLAARVAQLDPTRPAEVHALRRDELLTFQLVPQPAPDDTCDLWFIPDPQLSAAQRARRKAWLGDGV